MLFQFLLWLEVTRDWTSLWQLWSSNGHARDLIFNIFYFWLHVCMYSMYFGHIFCTALSSLAALSNSILFLGLCLYPYKVRVFIITHKSSRYGNERSKVSYQGIVTGLHLHTEFKAWNPIFKNHQKVLADLNVPCCFHGGYCSLYKFSDFLLSCHLAGLRPKPWMLMFVLICRPSPLL